ncbi:CaiB/BaiF CoA transferase family protein [Desulforhopalus singaporensis]|uniref:CoA:oxalate CoA-transferase n=1 Tax=Desulforhopalus singaporensis TaxID=91360 RepID=A0A1H0VUK2_9BACT|nr:CoA transferase [Desulforhopalus singaporensis]SDP82043.1 CoA:oxalate CoA-transferase [Desulforhopalus singaporensis]
MQNITTTQKQGPLSGVTVIDLTRVLAGPYCTMVLSDLGARVIKVENPNGGDDSRHIGPFVGSGQTTKSAYFMSLNRDKESIALDLKNDDDRKILFALLRNADVIIENFRPGVMEKLGLGWDVLKTRYPELIYAAVSGFGQSGPHRDRPAYDIVVQAMGGIMSVTGHKDQPPTRVGTSIGDITAGLFMSIAISTALYERTKTGTGTKIDVAMLDSQIAILENAVARYMALGENPQPLGTRHPSITPFSLFKAKDGYLVIAAGNNSLFQRLSEVLNAPELLEDPRFSTNALRTEHVETLTREIENLLANRSVSEWLDALSKAGVPSGPLNTVADILNDPHIEFRNMLITTEDPDIGQLKMAGNPIKFEGVPDLAKRPPAPDLDGDREKILAELGECVS